MDTFVLRTGQAHGLTGDRLRQFTERPDWPLVEKYLDWVLSVTRSTTHKVTFKLPE